ncbi:MAG: hypothetical protein NTW86_28615 [Candidatus Sumerlaeota bacterium]|nr:hypothetical protein [Candidatus Sumerlaeota bacterium]
MTAAMERRTNLLREGLARIAEGRERDLAETIRRRPVFWSRQIGEGAWFGAARDAGAEGMAERRSPIVDWD